MFIPFEPHYLVFGFGVIPLIGLPISLYYATARRTGRWQEANALFILSLAVFFVIDRSIGHVAFYKWAFFPAVIYFGSLAALAADWRPVSRHLAWTFVFVSALLNYHYVGSPAMRDYAPRRTQRERWDTLTSFLNDHLPTGVTVGGMKAETAYYLRSDLNSIGSFDALATNWRRDEAILRAAYTSYFVTYPNQEQEITKWY